MNINLNNQCTVVLTKHGAEIYNNYYKELWAECPKYIPAEKFAGDILKEPLWELMEMFGKYIHMGCETPFELCAIDIDLWENQK